MSPFAFGSSRDALISAASLGVVALIAGYGFMTVAARSVAEPITDVRRALHEIGEGHLDVELAVDDDGEIGSLQAGVNRMAMGLREREALRDLFGRHFFAVVVEEVADHNGFVNKFEGDAALAVFGAPIALDGAAEHALAAARSLAARLRAEVPQYPFGIGVAAGPVVAGNIGTESRFEYTVIGDPVNEAARLTERAKSVPGRVLASATLLTEASAGEARLWERGEDVTLRGRSAITRVATPIR